MAEGSREDERQYLLAVAARLTNLLTEVARVNRRLRNARTAVHALEDELAALCDEVTARAEALAVDGERPEP